MTNFGAFEGYTIFLEEQDAGWRFTLTGPAGRKFVAIVESAEEARRQAARKLADWMASPLGEEFEAAHGPERGAR